MADNHFINPDGLTTPTGYTHVVDTSGQRTIYISGQVAINNMGEIVGVGDIRAQTEQVFENLRIALAAVNATFNDVVKIGVFVTDISQIPIVREVRNRYLNMATPPASTAVEVRALVRPELLVEIEATAVLA